MCKALSTQDLFPVCTSGVSTMRSEFFPVCGNTIAHWIYCYWWDWIICITPQGRMPRSNPWGLILRDAEGSWYPVQCWMGMAFEPPVGQQFRVHRLWSCWRYLLFLLALAAGKHSSPFLGLERKTWVVLAQICVHISVFGGGTGGHQE